MRITKENSTETSKIITWFFLIVSILLLMFTYYRSEFIFHGTEVDKYRIYYIIFSIVLGTSVVILRLKSRVRINILIGFISSLVALFLIEISLIFVDSISNKDKELPQCKTNVDTRSKLQVLQDFEILGINAVPVVVPLNLIDSNYISQSEGLFSLSGVSNKITVGVRDGAKYLTYLSDRFGFNNPDYEWENVKKTEYLLVGDSFTQGVGSTNGGDIGSWIRKEANSSVINLGISGNGPLIELAGLVEYARHKKPKKVLWMFFEGNDLVENIKLESSNQILMSYLQSSFSQNLVYRQGEIDIKLIKHIRNTKLKESSTTLKSILESLFLSNVRNLIKLDSNRIDNVIPLFKKALIRANEVVNDFGGELYFIYLPEFYRYNTGVTNHDLYKDKERVINIVKGLNIPVIDIHKEVFNSHEDYLSLFPCRSGGHYNSDGYAEVAKAVVGSVKKYEDQNNK